MAYKMIIGLLFLVHIGFSQSGWQYNHLEEMYSDSIGDYILVYDFHGGRFHYFRGLYGERYYPSDITVYWLVDNLKIKLAKTSGFYAESLRYSADPAIYVRDARDYWSMKVHQALKAIEELNESIDTLKHD